MLAVLTAVLADPLEQGVDQHDRLLHAIATGVSGAGLVRPYISDRIDELKQTHTQTFRNIPKSSHGEDWCCHHNQAAVMIAKAGAVLLTEGCDHTGPLVMPRDKP